MLYVIFAILFFGFLIAIHEFGHFIVAKLSHVKVNEFSIGMGPQLLHKQGKETMYSLRALPIGGFCAMEGEDQDTDDPRSFFKAKTWKKVLILIAGSFMNFFIGLIILMVIYSGTKAQITPVIDGFMDGCEAYEQGYLLEGDRITRINGHAIWFSSDVSTMLELGNGETADIVVRRNGAKVSMKDVPMALHEYEEDGQTIYRYGLYFKVEETDFLENMGIALKTSGNFARMVWLSLEELFSGHAGMKDISGPIGIVTIMSDVGESSENVADAILNLLYFGAFIAVNLAVMNLLPLPALDGGRLFFIIINGILYLFFKKKIPAKYESYVHMAGMALLLALMAVVGINDVFRIFRR